MMGQKMMVCRGTDFTSLLNTLKANGHLVL